MADEQTPAPTGLAAEVDPAAVGDLLIGREFDAAYFAHGSDEYPRLRRVVDGVALEVTAIVGHDPAAGPLRELAKWAVVVGAAAQLDAAAVPEQQPGSTSALRAQYLALLAQLRSLPGTAGDGSAQNQGPLGTFPEPQAWPDAARQPGGRYTGQPRRAHGYGGWW